MFTINSILFRDNNRIILRPSDYPILYVLTFLLFINSINSFALALILHGFFLFVWLWFHELGRLVIFDLSILRNNVDGNDRAIVESGAIVAAAVSHANSAICVVHCLQNMLL